MGADYVDEKKVEAGVSISAFRDFFVKDGLAYSVVERCQFIKDNEDEESKDPHYAQLKKFIETNLVDSGKYLQLLVICCRKAGDEIVTHARTFLRHTPAKGKAHAIYYDPNDANFRSKVD